MMFLVVLSAWFILLVVGIFLGLRETKMCDHFYYNDDDEKSICLYCGEERL